MLTLNGSCRIDIVGSLAEFIPLLTRASRSVEYLRLCVVCCSMFNCCSMLIQFQFEFAVRIRVLSSQQMAMSPAVGSSK